MTHPTTLDPTPTDGYEALLAEATALRHEQLRGLPEDDDDPVVAAQRAVLHQTLGEIAGAHRRLAEGTFGTCTGCREPIPPARLELRPWAATCVACVGR